MVSILKMVLSYFIGLVVTDPLQVSLKSSKFDAGKFVTVVLLMSMFCFGLFSVLRLYALASQLKESSTRVMELESRLATDCMKPPPSIYGLSSKLAGPNLPEVK